MKFFRSTVYYWLLGLLLAVGTYISIATPVGGNFRDVAELTMSDPNSTIPVKAQMLGTIDGRIRARDKSGVERTIELPADVKINPNDYFIAEFSYRPADSTYSLKKVVSINPSFAFPFIPGLGELGKNMLFHVPMSFVAFVLFFLGTVYSFLLVRKRDLKYDL